MEGKKLTMHLLIKLLISGQSAGIKVRTINTYPVSECCP